MRLSVYTRELEECRRRWNRRSLRYVLAVARIIQRARKSVKDERRWCRWIREDVHMNRITVYRYLRVAEFLKANVSRVKQLEALGITRIFSLSRLPAAEAVRLLKDRKLLALDDVAFRRVVGQLVPRTRTRITLPNLKKAVEASLARLDAVLGRWRSSKVSLPSEVRATLLGRLRQFIRETEMPAPPAADAV